MHVGIAIIRARTFGLTQAEFGSLFGASQATVSNWDRGKGLSLVDVARFRARAKAQRLPWRDEWLFGERPDHEADALGHSHQGQAVERADARPSG